MTTEGNDMTEQFWAISGFQLDGPFFAGSKDTIKKGPFSAEKAARDKMYALTVTNGTTGVFLETEEGLLFLYDQETH